MKVIFLVSIILTVSNLAFAGETVSADVTVGKVTCKVGMYDDGSSAVQGMVFFVDLSHSAGVAFIRARGLKNVVLAKRVCSVLESVAGTSKVVTLTALPRVLLTAVTVDGTRYEYSPDTQQ